MIDAAFIHVGTDHARPKHAAFALDCNTKLSCDSLVVSERHWWGDQLANKAIAEVDPLKVLERPCDLYNYSPAVGSRTSPENSVYITQRTARPG